MCSRLRIFLRKYSNFCHRFNNGFSNGSISTRYIRRINSSAKLYKQNFRSPIKYTKHRRTSTATDVSKTDQDDSDGTDEDYEDSEITGLIDRSLYIREYGHQVLVIQPYVKWGPGKNRSTTPQLQLEEAKTLIKTLRNWKVVQGMTISLDRLNKPRFFGSGQLDNLKLMIKKMPQVTAVFISVNMLNTGQQLCIQEFLQVPVFDRYMIVIHIFREHATTKEAKLQIKLAELPYLWSRFKNIGKGSYVNFGSGSSIFESSWKGKEFHDQMLKQRELKIKKQILKLREHRKNIKKNRMANEIPTVAVVGYTNSGKTSLIKALTGKEKLEPQDYLFATLDVTVHEGKLPCSLKVLFVDTIGFLSDLPISLFESFVSTLEDVKVADVIIHVRDISHPDNFAQNENVLNTLRLLDLQGDMSENIITVGNKIDLIEREGLEKFKSEDIIFVSAKKMIGTGVLLEKIEDLVLKMTGRQSLVMKVRTSGEEYCWLHENAMVVDESPFPEDNQYSLVKVLITSVALARFKHVFIKDYWKQRKSG